MKEILPIAVSLTLMSCRDSYSPSLIDASDSYAQEILKPDWALVEDHFGVKMPPALKEFYAEPTKVLQEEFEIQNWKPIESKVLERVHVQNFSAINDYSIVMAKLTGGFLTVATDGAGGSYVFNPKLDNAEMHYYFVQDGAIFAMGLTLPEFLDAPRYEATWGER